MKLWFEKIKSLFSVQKSKMRDEKLIEEVNNPFLQRVIEHWLDSVNELTYQPVFCEWLQWQGYAVQYEIKQTILEQGKDVVAVDSAGTPHAYQLKGGNINLNRWHKEVKPEIEMLIDVPIKHPNINKNTPHISYLVTNRNIEDTVRVEIDDLNAKKWKETPLKVLTGGDLLHGFQKIVAEVLPNDAYAYRTLSNLIFADGTDFVDLSEVSSFLSQILNIETERRKEERKRDISAAILYTTMIISPYIGKSNHTSAIRILTLLISLILYLVDKYKLKEKYWLKSYRLVWNDMLHMAKELELEVENEGLDALLTDIFDKDLFQPNISLGQFRKCAAATIIFSFKMSKLLSDNDVNIENILPKENAAKYQGSLPVYGEAGFLPSVLVALMLTHSEVRKKEGVELMELAINEIIKENGRDAEPLGLLPPYFDLNFFVNKVFGVQQEPFDYQTKEHSYYLQPIITMMTRLNQKEFISARWKEMSFLYFEEFIFDNKYDYYLMNSEKGINMTKVPKKQKSWKELVDESKSLNGSSLPDSIKRFPEFIPFFLAIFPYRLNSDVLGFLFEKLEEKIKE